MIKIPTLKQRYLLVIILILIPALSFSQTSIIDAIADTTNIEAQFDYLYKKSNRYEQFKVISISGYNSIKKNSLDSIQKYKAEVGVSQAKINELEIQLTSNKDKLNEVNLELQNTKATKDSINLFGTGLSKGAYSSIMWGIILILFFLSVVLASLYKRGHLVVKSTKERLDEVQEEFEAHRKTALVREQKLARELMDVKLKTKSRSRS